MLVPLTKFACLLLNVVQSVELNAPRLVAEAVGTLSVITGVVVLVATLDDRSVPVVPKVSAETLVTVPDEGVCQVGVAEEPPEVKTCPLVPKLVEPVMLVFKPIAPEALITWAD